MAFPAASSAKTERKGGAVGAFVSNVIVLETIAENIKHSYEQLPWYSQPQSPSTVRRETREIAGVLRS